MAEVFVAGGAMAPDSLATYLGDMLPSEYVVVADPDVLDRHLDAIVIGLPGLIVLQAKEWGAVTSTVADAQSASREEHIYRDLAAGAKQEVSALR